uniref:Uncharacterized protein n=1 Tax=Glossina austeni TaxID=7395 RepID=A0A1A9VNA2_GLOAU
MLTKTSHDPREIFISSANLYNDDSILVIIDSIGSFKDLQMNVTEIRVPKLLKNEDRPMTVGGLVEASAKIPYNCDYAVIVSRNEATTTPSATAAARAAAAIQQ